MYMNPVNNPMDPRTMNSNNNSTNSKVKALVEEVKELRAANKELEENQESREELKKKHITTATLLCLSFLLALAVHEAIKYNINRSMKIGGGSSNLFVYYPLGILLLLAVTIYKVL